MIAAAVIEAFLDTAGFESWDAPVTQPDPDDAYRAALARAEARTGADEAVVTGAGLIDGRRVAVIVGEFGFLGGSIGAATADRIVAAFERATRERLPVVAAPCSGGTRMQEGTPAFVRMLDIARAVAAHRDAGLPYLTYLRHPTTGGVFASWGSLGQLTFAEPGALIGFLGPRVYESLHGESFPADVQTAENLAARGIVDAVLPLAETRTVFARVLRTLVDPVVPGRLARGAAAVPHEADAWAQIERTRSPERVGLHDILDACVDVVPLGGSGLGDADPAVVAALARVDGLPCMVIGLEARAGSVRPGGLRTAQRAIELAGESGLPVLTVIDTVGGELSAEAENSAMAGEIARCIHTLQRFRGSSLALLLGQGTGGAALALLGATSIIAMESAWLAPLPLEGASAIVHRDVEHAPQMARQQEVTAAALHRRGVIAHVIAEPAGADASALARLAIAEAGYRLSGSAAQGDPATLGGQLDDIAGHVVEEAVRQ